jgi:4-amino-4-deoxy-L-arabinose transferase-like glycosyltransferase
MFRLKSREDFNFVLMLPAVVYLLFVGLDNNVLWDDEAGGALVAKSVVKTGRISGWDGRNLQCFGEGASLYENLDSREPPLFILLAALSFKLFGYSTWSARLPFVLCGLASLLVLWPVLKRSFPEFGAVRYYAFSLVAFSYSFLMYSRQCRYYALALLAALCGYYFYLRILKRPSFVNFLLCLGSLLALFFTHFLVGAAFIISLVVVHFVFHRHGFSTRSWVCSIISAVAAVLATLPYAVAHRIWERPDIGKPSLSARPVLLYWNYRELDLVGFFPFLAVVALLAFLVRYRKKEFVPRAVWEWLSFVGLVPVWIALFSPQPANWQGVSGGLTDVRYMYILLPFCAGCMAVLLWILHRGFGAVFAFLVLALMLCSTLLTFNINNQPVRWPLPGFVYEIHHDYVTPYDTTVAYLAGNAADEDVLFCLPNYTASVFHFYLGDRIRIGSTLHRESCPIAVEHLRESGFVPYVDEYFPDWIAAFSMREGHAGMMEYFSRGPYAYKVDQLIRMFWKDMTRPELPWHSFTPQPQPAQPGACIFIYRRIDKAAVQQQPLPGGASAASPQPSSAQPHAPQGLAADSGNVPR